MKLNVKQRREEKTREEKKRKEKRRKERKRKTKIFNKIRKVDEKLEYEESLLYSTFLTLYIDHKNLLTNSTALSNNMKF